MRETLISLVLLRSFRLAFYGVFNTFRVPGAFDSVADGISRRVFHDMQVTFVVLLPYIPWQVNDLEEEGRALCTSNLASCCPKYHCPFV